MENKNLYIVSSSHRHQRESVNIKYMIHDILETRLELIEALAKTIGRGSFFCEGFTKDLCERTKMIFANCSPELIKRLADSAYLNSKYEKYEWLRFAGLSKELGKEGCQLDFKTTEKYSFEEMKKDELMYDMMLDFISKSGKCDEISASLESYKTREQESALLDKVFLDMRDCYIIENIVKESTEENILYIGSGHRLEQLKKTNLQSYRMEVDGMIEKGNHEITIIGSIPGRFKKNIESIVKVSRDSMNIRQELAYL